MAGEWTDPKRRGFTTSFAQFGAPAGMVLANGALAVTSVLTSEDAFLNWGWRVPFLLSVVLVFVGLYIRVGVLETPVFAKTAVSRGESSGRRCVKVLRHHWREVVLTALLRSGQQTPFYIFTTYVLTYATQQLGFNRSLILSFVMIQALVSMAAIPYFGHLSDVIGRRRITAIGCVVMMVFPFIYFGMLDTRVVWIVFLAIVARAAISGSAVRPAGGVHRRTLSGHAALQRRVARLSARVDHGRRPGADRRAVSVSASSGTSMAVAAYVCVDSADQPRVRVAAERSARFPRSQIAFRLQLPTSKHQVHKDANTKNTNSFRAVKLPNDHGGSEYSPLRR